MDEAASTVANQATRRTDPGGSGGLEVLRFRRRLLKILKQAEREGGETTRDGAGSGSSGDVVMRKLKPLGVSEAAHVLQGVRVNLKSPKPKFLTLSS